MSKLENADVHIDELKAQVDNALGAEEMLLELTEKNFEMGEASLLGCGIFVIKLTWFAENCRDANHH